MRNIVKSFFSFNADIIIFFILIAVKLFHYARIISPYKFQYSLDFAIIASILPLIAIAFIFKRKRMLYLYIVDLIISLLLVVDMIYFKYYKDILSVRTISNSVLLTGVTESVKQLLFFSDFIYLLDVVIIFPFIIFAKKIKIKYYSKKVRISLFVIVLCIGI